MARVANRKNRPGCAVKSPFPGSGLPSHSSHSWPSRRSVSMRMSWARAGAASTVMRVNHHLGVCRGQGRMVRGPRCSVASDATAHCVPRTLLARTPALLTDFRIRAAYSEGAGIHRIVPAAVVVPRGVEELQRLLRWALETGTRLVPRGAGSGMAGGSVGRDVVVDLSQGFRWTAPDWSRRTVWAGASVTWAEVTEAARPFGLRLPPDPSSGGFATSGGMAATNAAGPRSVRCGSVRHWVAAIEIIGADGEPRRVTRGEGSGERFDLSPEQRRIVATRFPKTRKNSAGYALNHFADSGDELDLLIGSEGTLAIVTAVEWRGQPDPPGAGRGGRGVPGPGETTEAGGLPP